MKSQSYNSYQYSYNFGQPQTRRGRHVYFSQKELKHISIAAALVVGIGFSIGFYENLFGGFRWTLDVMSVFALIMTISFLTHEIGHKVMAQRKNMWAEFRLTTWGAVLTLVSVFLPFKMISPGAMMIAGSPSADDIVKISIAGPSTNMAFAAAFLGLAFAFPSAPLYVSMLFFAAYINAFMAIFNLLPIGILDGFKIFAGNKKVWAVSFAISLALTIVTYLCMAYLPY
jgi:Zn-dependent protease